MSTSDRCTPAIAKACSAARAIGVKQVVGVGRRLESDVLPETLEPHRTMVTLSRHVGVGDQHAGAALHAHHRLEHVYRVGDHRAVEYVVDGDRLAMEYCAWMGAGIGPLV